MGTAPATLENIGTALATAPLNHGNVTFTVPHETEVTLSVLYNLPAYSNSAITAFSLTRLPSEILASTPDDVTGIENREQRIESNSRTLELSNSLVYDIHGRKVNGQRSKVKGQLPKGIYIVNGTKVEIK